MAKKRKHESKEYTDELQRKVIGIVNDFKCCHNYR